MVRQPDTSQIAGQIELFAKNETGKRGVRTANRSWDVLMMNARRQAESYARALPTSHGWPPFILVCDVGHVLEIYADFSGQGKNYAQFPDRQSFRVYLEDLRTAEVRDRLLKVWTDPFSLDPARATARVTRAIAERLAAVSKALEAQQYPAEEVAMFLMRALFTMFAEDIDLLPKRSFKDLLERCEQNPSAFVPEVGQLWEAMDTGGWAHALHQQVRRFNGQFFRSKLVFPLGREEIGELRQAATYDWQDVDPSIFGTLLEQALDANERRRLGAHYTPRSYVERLVVSTVIEPLRDDWNKVLSTAERQKSAGRAKDAVTTVKSFHGKLCATRILDPACGSGNFLYVSLELLKRLEGEVLEALADLGGQEGLSGLETHTVDPHQFLGIEINPRAAAIAELVLWIGHLQWHVRTKGGIPSEPILRAFNNIVVKDAVLAADIRLVRDERGKPIERREPDGKSREVYAYDNPHRPDWAASDFIVGNPPFVAGQNFREEFGDNYAEALWKTYPEISGGADLVMYWWDRAAELLTRKGAPLRRFGFVTTNSITQEFSRRVVARHLRSKRPVSIIMAIPNHPWTKATKGAAAVRIAMTVAESGNHDGNLRQTVTEEALDTDEPRITFEERRGRINPNLTVGIDVTTAAKLLANEGICHDGVKLHGKGFIIRSADAVHMGGRQGLDVEAVIRPYLNGRDINQHSRGLMVIDLFGFEEADVRQKFPAVYHYLLHAVRPEREKNNRESYRDLWWIFGEPRRELRPALSGITRYIATVDTATHRIFQFLPATTVCDDKVVIIASDDAYHLGVLSSRIHVLWALAQSTRLGQGDDPVYPKGRCFSPFPFPDTDTPNAIRDIGSELDAHRKRVLADDPSLTLTDLYNVLEKLRGGILPQSLGTEDRAIFESGLVLVLKKLHEDLDAAVTRAYGWVQGLTTEELLSRLVTLNKQRAEEEARGMVRWLRPDYQVPLFGSTKQKAELDLVGGVMRAQDSTGKVKPIYPSEEVAQTAAVMSALATASGPLDAAAIASTFRQGRRVVPTVSATLGALFRMGFVITKDNGLSFALNKLP